MDTEPIVWSCCHLEVRASHISPIAPEIIPQSLDDTGSLVLLVRPHVNVTRRDSPEALEPSPIAPKTVEDPPAMHLIRFYYVSLFICLLFIISITHILSLEGMADGEIIRDGNMSTKETARN